MRVIKNPKEMTKASRETRAKGKTIGFVPTLGYLHDGHKALISAAKKENDVVIVSRFVNPLQFRAKAFAVYPRDEKMDIAICRDAGVDCLFSPSTEAMYPEGFDTSVEVEDLTGRLEGARIRWHYRGVTTVVAKLFNIVQPDRAYFGKKDAHQLAILKRMTDDLNFPIRIVSVATRRAGDGLALSSRNSMLTPEERVAAVVIPRSVKAVAQMVKSGNRDRAGMSKTLRAMIEKEPNAKVDFAAVVDAETLRDDVYGASTLVYTAVFVGGKRLTDNMVVKSKT
ncbi:MAG: pantoate--beta-alanine ligase [Nitrospinae bacterium]|nr:pantoate--beta-alanine ligase [Nitrospinota bacterium]MBF0633450.1 pantoate--beta-alanine ligase [Nitrospinota bacterium]